jgi:hypothetical protein
MVRSTPTASPNEPRRGRQKHDRKEDLQKEGEHASDRAYLPNRYLDEALNNSAFDSHMTFGSESKGTWWASAKVRLGNADLSPTSLAALSAGVSVFFILGAGLLVMAGHPGYAYATFVLAFVTLLGGICFAFYDSKTRAVIAQADLAKTEIARAQEATALAELAKARETRMLAEIAKAGTAAPVMHEKVLQVTLERVTGPIELGHAECDIKPESLLRQAIPEDPASPPAFGGGETV